MCLPFLVVSVWAQEAAVTNWLIWNSVLQALYNKSKYTDYTSQYCKELYEICIQCDEANAGGAPPCGLNGKTWPCCRCESTASTDLPFPSACTLVYVGNDYLKQKRNVNVGRYYLDCSEPEETAPTDNPAPSR